MDNEDDIMNENMNEEDYLSEEEDDDEEFDINAGNLPAFANAENRSLSKALEDKEAQVELLAREAEENEEREGRDKCACVLLFLACRQGYKSYPEITRVISE